MTDTKLSALTEISYPLVSTDEFYVARGATSRRATVGSFVAQLTPSIRERFFYEDDFINVPAASGTLWDIQNSGGVVSGTPIAGRPGCVNFTSGTTATSYSGIARTLNAGSAVVGEGIVVGGGEIIWEAAVRPNDIPSAAQDMILRIGQADEITTVPTNGYYFTCGWTATNGAPNFGAAVWGGAAISASSLGVNTNNNVPMVAGTWVVLKMVVNATGTQIDYYVDEVLCATMTTNIPTGGTVPAFQIAKAVGITTYSFTIDWIRIIQTFTTPR